METLIAPRKLVKNPHFEEQKQKSLTNLTDDMIDAPIIETINKLNKLSYCFTLQSCYGHFLHDNQNNETNLGPLPAKSSNTRVEYRIAYIAFCIENSESGEHFIKSLKDITLIDPDNIQFCSATWFWERQLNSYALQVEPDRFKRADRAIIEYQEAVYIDKLRNEFFFRIEDLIC